MAIDPDAKTMWNNIGQKHASEGKWSHEPWCGPFESTEHYEERRDAYKAGYDNASDDGPSLCFLTTACVEHAGLPDDCYELTVLRRFRDSYVANLPGGRSMLSEYYVVAPGIVRGIQRSDDREDVLRRTLATIRQAVEHIEAGRAFEAFTLYATMFTTLKQRYTAPDAAHQGGGCRGV